MQALIHVPPPQAGIFARTGSGRALALCGGLVAMALVLPAFQRSFLAGSAALAQEKPRGCPAVSARTAHATEAAGRAHHLTAASAAFATVTPAQMTCGQLFATYPPEDEALGNLGGDPFAYHVFNRDAELSELRQSSDTCLNRTAEIAGQ
jgi:hypothetical protein